MVRQSDVAKAFGFAFLVVGILGFIPNPIASPDGIFEVNAVHNVVHLLSGLLALAAGYSSDENHAKAYNVGFGVVYALVTVLGFLGVGFVVDLLALNTADNFLHLLFTVILLGAGLSIETRTPAGAHA